MLPVPLPLVVIGVVVYFALSLGRWKTLAVFVALNLAVFLWLLQTVAAAHNTAGSGDGIFVALLVAVPASIIALIRAVVLVLGRRPPPR